MAKKKSKTIQGVCDFHSETGTEGGYWAFQDKRFITENTIQVKCKNCDLIWHKEREPDRFLVPPQGPPLECTHIFETWPSHFFSYDGLHHLKNGDHLSILQPDSKKNAGKDSKLHIKMPKKVVWEGVIDLKYYPLFSQDAFGLWIHSDQKGVVREEWATWFMDGYPAELTPTKKKR